jgi:hypothetical protein
MKRWFCIAVLLKFLFSASLTGQEILLPASLENIIEDIVSSLEDETDLSIILEDLYSLLENPLDLNKASASELSKIWILDDFAINRLLDYINRSGPIRSIYELVYVEDFDPDLISKIAPFIAIGTEPIAPALSARNVFKYGRNRLYTRVQQVMEKQKGFSSITDSALAANPTSRYLGSPLKLYTRYQFDYRNQVQWGMTAEKDAGEEFFRGSNPYGYDFYSAHLCLRNMGKLKRLVLGDFHARFGQGLILWPGYSQGKTNVIHQIRRNQSGLIRYASTDENFFMRGAGTTISLSKQAEFSVFFSGKKIDATIQSRDPETNEVLSVSSLQTSGLHATSSQTEQKNALGETTAGGNITIRGDLLKVGFTGLYYRYSVPLQPAERAYNQFAFRGTENLNAGVDYQLVTGNLTLFGEAAISKNKGKAILSGFLMNAGPRISLAGLFRLYTRDYQAYFSNAFGESSSTINEKGFYTGFVFLPFPGWKISGFFDFYQFPWLRYNAYAPGFGWDYTLQTDYAPASGISMYFRIRQKTKPSNQPASEPLIRTTGDVSTRNFRYQINYKMFPFLEFRNRLEMNSYHKEGNALEEGFLIYQDVLLRFSQIPLSVSMRFALFDTDSYNSRIYAYENDILYAFSIPAYYDEGSRTYLNIAYSLSTGIDFWFRVARTHLPGRESIGTGLSEIEGNSRTELKFQARFTF